MKMKNTYVVYVETADGTILHEEWFNGFNAAKKRKKELMESHWDCDVYIAETETD